MTSIEVNRDWGTIEASGTEEVPIQGQAECGEEMGAGPQETLAPPRVEIALEVGETRPAPTPAECPTCQQDHLQTRDSIPGLEREQEAALSGLCLVSGKACPQERASNEEAGETSAVAADSLSEGGAPLLHHHHSV